MWYVNNDLGNRVYLCNERFILTMWYVNHNWQCKCGEIIQVLY